MASHLGTKFFKFFADLGMDMVLQGLPTFQSYVLLGITVMLPFGMVFGAYPVNFLVTGGIVLFSVHFWTALWHIAEWLREQMMIAARGDASAPEWLADELLGQLGLHVSNAHQGRMVDLVALGGYVLFPALFSLALTWAGMRAGTGVASLASAAQRTPAADVASSTKNTAQGVTTSTIRRGGK